MKRVGFVFPSRAKPLLKQLWHQSISMNNFQLLDAVTKKLEIKESPLPQDMAEGVDDDEWVCKTLVFYHLLTELLPLS